LGERLLCKQEVVGSIPSGSTITKGLIMLSDVPINRIDTLSKQSKQIDQFMMESIPNEAIANFIISEGDVQKYDTNLKCDMTSWNFHKKNNDVRTLADNITDLINKQDHFQWILDDCWGAVYREGNTAVMHSHYPYGKSFIYYVKAPQGCSPLVFDNSYYRDQVYTITPKTGMLVVFPSDCDHSVPVSTSKEDRIIMSGNLFYLPYGVTINTV
jgi:hypothetical protein